MSMHEIGCFAAVTGKAKHPVQERQHLIYPVFAKPKRFLARLARCSRR